MSVVHSAFVLAISRCIHTNTLRWLGRFEATKESGKFLRCLQHTLRESFAGVKDDIWPPRLWETEVVYLQLSRTNTCGQIRVAYGIDFKVKGSWYLHVFKPMNFAKSLRNTAKSALQWNLGSSSLDNQFNYFESLNISPSHSDYIYACAADKSVHSHVGAYESICIVHRQRACPARFKRMHRPPFCPF